MLSTVNQEFLCGEEKAFTKKEVLFSEEDLKEKIFLEIGASAMKSTVYMNGKTICHNTCPYAMYRIALNEHINGWEKNLVRNCNRQYGDG